METIGTQPTKPPRSDLAIISLVLGIVSLIPLVGVLLGALAIIFGILAYFQIKKGGQSGRGLARAGIILGVLGIALTFIFYGSLYYFGFKSKTGPFIPLKNQVSQQILTQNAGALELYKNKYGQYPENLEEASQVGFTVFPMDHYLKPFHYQISEGKQSYELRSLGADGVYGTQDDILLNQ